MAETFRTFIFLNNLKAGRNKFNIKSKRRAKKLPVKKCDSLPRRSAPHQKATVEISRNRAETPPPANKLANKSAGKIIIVFSPPAAFQPDIFLVKLLHPAAATNRRAHKTATHTKPPYTRKHNAHKTRRRKKYPGRQKRPTDTAQY